MINKKQIINTRIKNKKSFLKSEEKLCKTIVDKLN